MASVDTISFEVEGFNQVFNAILELENDVKKVNEIRKILRRQAMPAQRVMVREAPIRKPISNNGVTRTRLDVVRNGTTYRPGNLKRSIRLFNGKNRDFPTVYIGAQAKKPEGSGYYSSFVQYGTQRDDNRAITNKDNYVKRADDLIGDVMGQKASEELALYIKRKVKRLGFV